VVALGLAGGGLCAQAQHIHLAAGAENQSQGSKLRLVNGASYDINSNIGASSPPTPACFFMSDDDPDLYPNLYQVEVGFTALPATIWTGGVAGSAAAQGAYIEAKMVSVSGPVGGEISFWEQNEEATATTRRFTLPVGTSNSTNRFNLSEGVDTPDGPDPYGHIHGRRFTANKAGLYTVGFQLIDTSTAGENGGPIHSPSSPINYFYFQAGVYIDSMTKTNSTVTVQFGARSFHDYYLEANTNLATTNWLVIATNILIVLPGNPPHSDLHYMSDTNATNVARFYRLREIAQ
jgi:hypothetical protein